MAEEAAVKFDGPAAMLLLRPLNAFVRSLMEQLPPFENNPKWIDNIELVINEVFTNVIRHAYPGEKHGRLAVEVNLRSDRIEFVFHDWGVGFDPDAVPEPNFDDPSPGGYGLFCIRQLMDEYSYAAGVNGPNVLTVVKWYENVTNNDCGECPSSAIS